MKSIKAIVLGFAVGILAMAPASADVQAYSFSDGFVPGGTIPDGNTTGWSDTRQITDWAEGSLIGEVKVTLDISGGFNGDLYAYLTHGSGFAVLLNRVGRTDSNLFGFGDTGMNLTLDDGAATDIHVYGGNNGNSLTGIWQPDGRNVSPLLVTESSLRDAPLASFQGLDPNGEWTLFIADLSGGGESILQSWGMEITAIPEPSSLLLGAVGLAGFFLARWSRSAK